MNAKIGRASTVAVADETPRPEATTEEIAARAYEIHLSGTGGDDVENWFRAEQELNGDLHEDETPEVEQEDEQQLEADAA